MTDPAGFKPERYPPVSATQTGSIAPDSAPNLLYGAGKAIAAAIARRHERHMPGNPFPLGSPWGRELDRRYAADQAMDRFRRMQERSAYGLRLGQGRLA